METGTAAAATAPRGSGCPAFEAAVLSRRTLASWPGVELQVARARIGAGVSSSSRSAEHKIFLTLAGATTLTETRTDGGRPYSGRDAPGAVSFVPGGRRREGRYVGGWMEYARVLIEPGLLARHAGDAELRPADNVRDPLIRGAVLALKEEADRGGDGGRAYAEALVAALCAHLVRRYSGDPPPQAPRHAGGLAGPRLRRVLERMGEGLGEPLPLAELAALADMSADGFARAFRLATGEPPHRYLTGLRLERARQLLAATDRPIAEVAHRVGLSSQSHLTTLFHRAYGTTPHAYRRGSAGA